MNKLLDIIDTTNEPNILQTMDIQCCDYLNLTKKEVLIAKHIIKYNGMLRFEEGEYSKFAHIHPLDDRFYKIRIDSAKRIYDALGMKIMQSYEVYPRMYPIGFAYTLKRYN